MQKFSPGVALVTGAARRIGAAIAEHLHRDGFYVFIHYHRSEQAAMDLVVALNHIRPMSATAVQGDLSLSHTVDHIMNEVLSRHQQLNVLVNNASIFSRHDEDAEKMWQCNVRAPYMLSRRAFPALRITEGCIVNITDIHAQRPLRDYAAYCQTKAALAMQTCALAQEFAPNVRVNAVAPGAIVWPEGDNDLDPIVQEKIIAKIPLKRHGTPFHVAQAVLHFVNNTYLTGQSLQVDGGRSI